MASSSKNNPLDDDMNVNVDDEDAVPDLSALPYIPDGFIPSLDVFGKRYSEQLHNFTERYIHYATLWKLPELPPISHFNSDVDYGKLFGLYTYVVKTGGYFGVRCTKRWSEVNCIVAYNQASRTAVQPYYIKYLLRFEFQHQYLSDSYIPDIDWKQDDHLIIEQLIEFVKFMQYTPSRLQIKQANAYKNYLENQRKLRKFKKKLHPANQQAQADEESINDEYNIQDEKTDLHERDLSMHGSESPHHHRHRQKQETHVIKHENYNGMVNRLMMSLSACTVYDINWALNTLMHMTHTAVVETMANNGNQLDKHGAVLNTPVDADTLNTFRQYVSKRWYTYTSSMLSSMMLLEEAVNEEDNNDSLQDPDMISFFLRKPMKLASLINTILSIVYQYYKRHTKIILMSNYLIEYNEQQFLACLTILHNMTSHHLLCQYISSHGAMISILFDIMKNFIDNIQVVKLSFGILSNILCTCRHMKQQRNFIIQMIQFIVQIIHDYNYVLLQRSTSTQHPSSKNDNTTITHLQRYDQLYQSALYTLNVIVSHHMNSKPESSVAADNHITSDTYTQLLMYGRSIKLPVDINILSLQSLLCCYKHSNVLRNQIFADHLNIKRLIELLNHRDAEVRRTAAAFVAHIYNYHSNIRCNLHKVETPANDDTNMQRRHNGDVSDGVMKAFTDYDSLLVNACSHDLDIAHYLAPVLLRLTNSLLSKA